MKTGLNDIGIKKLGNCITGKYWLFYTFSVNLREFPLFITKLWALESYKY